MILEILAVRVVYKYKKAVEQDGSPEKALRGAGGRVIVRDHVHGAIVLPFGATTVDASPEDPCIFKFESSSMVHKGASISALQTTDGINGKRER